MDIDTALLRQTALFQGMEDGEIRQLLACLHCPVRRYGRGEFLWHAGDAVPMAGIVLSGCAISRSPNTPPFSCRAVSTAPP